MMINTLKFCSKHISFTTFDYNLYSFGGTHRRWYANGNKTETPQTAGRTVQSSPKSDPTPSQWRCDCPQPTAPCNNDPYRIKVQEIAVPPMPPSNAKPSLDCSRTRGTCTPPAPPPPPCPPTPKKPFPWIYVWLPTALLAALGLIYRYWAYKEKQRKSGVYDSVWKPRTRTRRPRYDYDLPQCVQYLIIGTGTAGWAAYNSIMENDKKAKVFFLTNEDIFPYDRKPMSKEMWWNKLPPDTNTLNYIYKEKYRSMYRAKCDTFMETLKFNKKLEGPAVSIGYGWCVTRIDAENHVVYIKTLCGDRPMYYERALIAVGSKPINLDIFKVAQKEVRDKVTTFRTIRDLESAFRKARAARHVTVIGGGPMGCELAYYLAKMKEKVQDEDAAKLPLEIVHMYKDGGVLGSILPEYLGEWAAEKIKCAGVTMMPKTTAHDAFLTKDNRLELTLNNGSSVVTDYVFVCVGSTPRMEIAEPSLLEEDHVNGGFLANTELLVRTHLYAAGDAASFYSQWKDTRQRFQNDTPAAEQGQIAGLNMTGYWEPCNVENSSWVILGDALEMQIVGDVGACMPTIAIYKPCRPEDLPPKEREASIAENCYKDAAEYKERYKRGMLCYIRDETIVGFVFWNLPPLDDRKCIATEILRARPHYNDINLVADLLGFSETHCVYLRPEEMVEVGPCIEVYREY